MIDKEHFKDILTYILIIALLVLAVIILKPIAAAIIYGLLLAYILFPIHRIVLKKIKNEYIASFIVCIGLFVVVGGVIAIIISTLFDQLLDFYFTLKGAELSTTLLNIFEKLPFPPEVTSSLADNIRTSFSNLLLNFLGKFNEFLLKIPILALNFLVFLFVLFFTLKDGEKAINYLKSVSPIKKETEEKFLKKFKDVTNSVLLGQVLVGIVQGLTAGVGFFIFKVDNALLLTILSIICSVIPMVGPWLVWVPVNVILFSSTKPEIAIGFLIYNMFLTSLIDNVLRPFVVSRKTEINSAIIIVGMVGGFLVFGILGLIIGPLVLAYVLLMMEIYKKKNLDENNKKEV